MRTDIQELRDRRGGLALEDSGNGVTPNTWQLEAEMLPSVDIQIFATDLSDCWPEFLPLFPEKGLAVPWK